MATKRSRTPKHAAGRDWSKRVMETSDALDLQNGVFKLPPKKMASSLSAPAAAAASPLRSAMSMLSFYENHARRKLPGSRKPQLAQAEQELRRLFGKER